MIPCNSEFRAYALVRQRYMYVCIVQLRGTWPTHTQNLCALHCVLHKKKKKARVKAHVLSTFLFLLFNAVSVLVCFERYPFVRAIPHSPFIIHHSSFPIPHSPFLIPHSSFLIFKIALSWFNVLEVE